MKFVITGALGHIGSRLIRSIPTHTPNAEIVMIDNLSTQRYSSLFNLPSQAKYRFIEGSVDQMDLLPVFSGADGVVHLAAITNAEGSFEMKEQVERNNFEGTRRVAETCLALNCPLVYPSSTSVYGTSKERVTEDCSTDDLKPQSPYAETKLREENLLLSMRKAGLPFVICRLGTIFGTSPGMRFHTAVNKFCWQATYGYPISIWKTALHQVRPYLDLTDAVRAILYIISKQQYDQQIYNVLTLNSSVSNIIQIIHTYIPNISISYVDTKIMNQLSYEVSNNKFKDLGFQFTGNITIGIQETLHLLGNRLERDNEKVAA